MAGPLRNAIKTTTPEHSLLPLLAAIVGHQQGRVRILDFGGGAGIGFVHVAHALASDITLDYHVIELPLMCERAPKLFAGDGRIRFHDRLPKDLGSIDIVHLSTCLQYIEDSNGLLRSLCRYQPAYVFLAKLSAGDFPTFVSAQQNLEGNVLPYRFFNVAELVGLMEANGYRLLCKSVMGPEYHQSNFPPEYRMGRPCNLLFGGGTGP
jgi:putative methyltransferase (TIGR04325 family)